MTPRRKPVGIRGDPETVQPERRSWGTSDNTIHGVGSHLSRRFAFARTQGGGEHLHRRLRQPPRAARIRRRHHSGRSGTSECRTRKGRNRSRGCPQWGGFRPTKGRHRLRKPASIADTVSGWAGRCTVSTSADYLHAWRCAPGLVLPVRSVDEVRDALAFDRAQGVPLATRSGGHGISGWSTNNGGIVIDLRALNSIEILDPSRRIVRVGAGARWVEGADFLEPCGLALAVYNCREAPRSPVNLMIATVGSPATVTWGSPCVSFCRRSRHGRGRGPRGVPRRANASARSRPS